ncbi:MAG: hypothetical protein KDC48_10710, partial [Planctomycetes bacterium]|nr:hypothetical protein [Planctomycetota bacterium]
AAAMAREPHPGLPRRGEGPSIAIDPPRLLHDDLLYSLKSLMWRQVGLSRDAQGLDDARTRIAFWHHYLLRAPLPNRRVCELANMLTVAALVAEAGFTRDESRGTHFRSDRPQRDDAAWCRRIFLERTGDGRIHATAGPHHEPTDPSLSKSPAP